MENETRICTHWSHRLEAFTLILLLLAAVLVSSVLDQLVPRVSAPLIQIALGFIIAMLAVTPFHFSVDPDLFLVLFIAPLLFDEAKRADKGSLWKNKRSIASLAIGLVLAIVLAVGFVTNALIPSIPLAAAFALGAALGPTDAVAVSAMKKEIQLTERQEALLGGESLINDASGIVSFQYAIAAVTTGAFSVLDAGVTFVEEFLGGILLGLALGAALTWLMRKIRSLGLDNNTFHVLFEVFTPFIIFLFGDAIHVSGILAVVAAGLVISFTPRRIGPVQSHYSIVSSSVWRVLAYTLNGIVFVLLGMQLPLAMTSTWVDHSISNEWLLMTIAVLTVVLTLVRFAWVLCMELLHHDRVTGHRPKLSAALVRDVAVTTLAGPKGAITLSIAFTIPVFLSSSGDYFPQRDVIIFLASGVIVCTLLLANFVVPLIAPKRAVDTQAAERVALVNIEILRTVIEELTRQQTLENKAATRAVIRSYNARIARLQQSNDLDTEPREALRIKIIRAQQNHALHRIEANDLDPVIGYRYIQRLGRMQNFIKHRTDNSWLVRNALRHLRITLSVLWRSLLEKVPGASTTERSDVIHELTVEGEQIAVDLLRGEMELPHFKAETIGSLLVEHENILRTLKTSKASPSITTIARVTDKAVDIEREALSMELELIHDAYEEERLTRAEAKKLRESVHLMQLDLEDRV